MSPTFNINHKNSTIMSDQSKICIAALTALSLLSLPSCSDDVGPVADESPGCHFLMPDTIVSRERSEFRIPIIGNLPEDATAFIANEWTENPRNSYRENWSEYTSGCVRSLDLDASGVLRVDMDENTSDRMRGVEVVIASGSVNPRQESFIIWQRGRRFDTIGSIRCRYNGRMYSSPVIPTSDSTIRYESPLYQYLVDSLAEIDGVNAVLAESDIVDYYVGDNPCIPGIGTVYLGNENVRGMACSPRYPVEATRAGDPFQWQSSNALGYCALFDDSNYTDTYMYYNLLGLNKFEDCNKMSNKNLNDKVSSLAVSYNGTNKDVCAVLTIWEDSDYNNGDNDRTKHRISVIATYDQRKVMYPDLKKIKCIGSSNSWNDRISSLSFHFGYVDSQWKNY